MRTAWLSLLLLAVAALAAGVAVRPAGAVFPAGQPPIQVSPVELTITVTVEAFFAIVPEPVQ